jgi:hypothetical protein
VGDIHEARHKRETRRLPARRGSDISGCDSLSMDRDGHRQEKRRRFTEHPCILR